MFAFICERLGVDKEIAIGFQGVLKYQASSSSFKFSRSRICPSCAGGPVTLRNAQTRKRREIDALILCYNIYTHYWTLSPRYEQTTVLR